MASFYHIYISARDGVSLDDIKKKMDLAVDWFRYDHKNWIVYTTSNAKKWYSRLKPFVDPGGRVLIFRLDPADHWGFMSDELWEWLKERR
jgi:hypothetical protein